MCTEKWIDYACGHLGYIASCECDKLATHGPVYHCIQTKLSHGIGFVPVCILDPESWDRIEEPSVGDRQAFNETVQSKTPDEDDSEKLDLEQPQIEQCRRAQEDHATLVNEEDQAYQDDDDDSHGTPRLRFDLEAFIYTEGPAESTKSDTWLYSGRPLPMLEYNVEEVWSSDDEDQQRAADPSDSDRVGGISLGGSTLWETGGVQGDSSSSGPQSLARSPTPETPPIFDATRPLADASETSNVLPSCVLRSHQQRVSLVVDPPVRVLYPDEFPRDNYMSHLSTPPGKQSVWLADLTAKEMNYLVPQSRLEHLEHLLCPTTAICPLCPRWTSPNSEISSDTKRWIDENNALHHIRFSLQHDFSASTIDWDIAEWPQHQLCDPGAEIQPPWVRPEWGPRLGRALIRLDLFMDLDENFSMVILSPPFIQENGDLDVTEFVFLGRRPTLQPRQPVSLPSVQPQSPISDAMDVDEAATLDETSRDGEYMTGGNDARQPTRKRQKR